MTIGLPDGTDNWMMQHLIDEQQGLRLQYTLSGEEVYQKALTMRRDHLSRDYLAGWDEILILPK